MPGIKSFRDLTVWQRSMDLAQEIYALTKGFPKAEEYRITSQMTRAAISIPANIAEGNARASRKDYARFVSIARGSAAELETFLILANRTNLGAKEQIELNLQNCEAVGRMLTALHKSLSRESKK